MRLTFIILKLHDDVSNVISKYYFFTKNRNSTGDKIRIIKRRVS